MNERIKLLAEQCRIETHGVNGELLAADFDEQKFAELIVRECAKAAYKYIDDSKTEFENLYNQIDKTKTYSVVGSGLRRLRLWRQE